MSDPILTVHEAAAPTSAPSAADDLIKAALAESVVSDGRGRRIMLRKPSVLAQFRLVQVVGPDVSANQALMQMINPLIFVVKIDDDDVLFPSSYREVEALIQRLDEDGLAAVMGWYMANVIGPAVDAMKMAAAKDDLKN